MDPKHEIVQELHPMVTPDSLRQLMKLKKSFFDAHVSSNMGHTDVDGLQYASMIQNDGIELLTEARKVRLDHPPLEKLYNFYQIYPNISNDLQFFCELQYSELIEHPSQQNMIEAILKKNVLIKGHIYHLCFDQATQISIWRSRQYGTEMMYPVKFYHTTSAPILKEYDEQNQLIRSYILSFITQTDKSSHYYYRKRTTFEDTPFFTDNTPLDDVIIDPISLYEELPLFYICTDDFSSMPKEEDVLSVNHYQNNESDRIFDIGANGHGQFYFLKHPYVNESNYVSYQDQNWFIKVFTKQNLFQNNEKDIMCPINRIVVYHASSYNNEPDPQSYQEMIVNTEYAKITIADLSKWHLRKPQPEDALYDNIYFNNPKYYWTEFNHDKNPILFDHMNPIFKIVYNAMYIHSFEASCEDAVSGIFIDNGSDVSNTSARKKNGVIHHLGEFNGLPNYYHYTLQDTILHPRVGIYAIHDAFNTKNQKIMDKNTVAILIDAAIPRTSSNEDASALDTVIVYKMNHAFDENPTYYFTDEEDKNWSSLNALSEITYHDDNTFSNCNIPGYEEEKKFIYHGNRTFSLSLLDKGAENEIARVFVISNDGIEYENNALLSEERRKPLRTAARICDIPTSFTQLIHIENHAPTVVIDENYQRSECNYSMLIPERLWNQLESRWIKFPPIKKPYQWFHYPNNMGGDLNLLISPYEMLHYYSKWINLNHRLLLSSTSSYSFELVSGGSNYVQNDAFYFLIGGLEISGTIVNVDQNGSVTSIQINTQDGIISPGNLSGSHTIFSCYQKDVTHIGMGLQVSLVIPDEIWESQFIRKRNETSFAVDYTYPFSMFTFRIDQYGYTWAWEYNIQQQKWVEASQMTGMLDPRNSYDNDTLRSIYSKLKRDVNSIFMDRLFKMQSTIFGKKSTIHYQTSLKMIDYHYQPDLDYLSYILEIDGINEQDTIYYIQPTDGEYANVTAIEKEESVTAMPLPRFHTMNLSHYKNKACRLHYEEKENMQPNIYVYNPMKSIHKEYDEFQLDKMRITKTIPITIQLLDESLMDERGCLKQHIYEYNEYQMSDGLVQLYDKLQLMTRNELLQHIRMTISQSAEPLLFDDTMTNRIEGYLQSIEQIFYEDAAFTMPMIADTSHVYIDLATDLAYRWDYDAHTFYQIRQYCYSKERLIQYILLNTYPSESESKNPKIKLLQRKGEQIENEGQPVGKHPTGDFSIASAKEYHLSYYINQNETKYTSSLLYFFEFKPKESDRIRELSDFRIYDASGIDISDNCILKFKGDCYLFINYNWKKIKWKGE